jgi:hypothetical protein
MACKHWPSKRYTGKTTTRNFLDGVAVPSWEVPQDLRSDQSSEGTFCSPLVRDYKHLAALLSL